MTKQITKLSSLYLVLLTSYLIQRLIVEFYHLAEHPAEKKARHVFYLISCQKHGLWYQQQLANRK